MHIGKLGSKTFVELGKIVSIETSERTDEWITIIQLDCQSSVHPVYSDWTVEEVMAALFKLEAQRRVAR